MANTIHVDVVSAEEQIFQMLEVESAWRRAHGVRLNESDAE